MALNIWNQSAEIKWPEDPASKHGSFETMDIGPVTPYELGYNAGSNGMSYKYSPNIYLPSESNYDGVDSMGAAAAWYNGWTKARRTLGLGTQDYGKKCEPESVNDDYAYFEIERQE